MAQSQVRSKGPPTESPKLHNPAKNIGKMCYVTTFHVVFFNYQA